MLLDQDQTTNASNAILNAVPPVDDAAARLLRHVLKVWAREQGLPEAQVPNLIEGVLHYATTGILDGRFGRTGGA
ncbi:MAG TPA: hypothetical protein VN157_14255 [Caulobacter sp.]|nr:hypothetical protein [Caulobacter sp.]